MTLGELLKMHLREPLTQKSVAMSWHGQAEEAGQRWRPSTIESHLSRCLRDQQQGVRFFFEVRERARMLLDIMSVPEGARARIHAAAEELLKVDKDRPPGLIIDITMFSGHVEPRRLFEALRAAIVEPRPLEPTLLLLTETQYDDLPRSFDQHAEWLRVEMVTATEIAARLLDPALAGALVASPWRYQPERWLAMSFDSRLGTFVFEPPDGLERFARDGSLPLPVVVHELSRFVGNGPLPQLDLSSLGPLEQRRAMVNLALEDRAEQVAPDPARRLAIARALGVPATATPRDRIEAELRSAVAALGVPRIEAVPAAKLEELLERARRRPQPPTIVRSGDLIEVVNPVKEQTGLDHPRVRVHRIEAAIPAITRLRAAVSRWTRGDFEADPFLYRLIERLDPESRERRAFLHARAVLLARTFSPPLGRSIEDWRSALQRFLAHDVPPVTLRLIMGSTDASDAYLTIEAPAWVAAALEGVPGNASHLQHPRPALADAVPISGDVNVMAAKGRSSNDLYRRRSAIEDHGEEIAAPGVSNADERWLDSFDAWMSGRPASGLDPVDVYNPIKAFPWDEADRHLGLVWLALRSAVQSAPAVQLHDGRALMPLGDGLVAQVDVHETAEPVELEAMLDASEDRSRSQNRSHWKLDLGVPSGVMNIDLSIPARVILLGERLRVEVVFFGSPFFAGANARPVIRAAALQRQEAEQAEEAERAARERDDD